MFAIDAAFTHVDVTREQLLTLLASMNAVTANVPGMPMSPAMAYVAAWQTRPGSGQMVIYLYYRTVDRAVGYRPSPAIFPLASLPELLAEAREFLESMGFMLDDLAFTAQPPAKQEALLTRLPLFYRDLKTFAQAREALEVEDAEIVAIPDADATPIPALAPAKPRTAVPVSPKPPVASAPAQGRAERLGRLLASF